MIWPVFALTSIIEIFSVRTRIEKIVPPQAAWFSVGSRDPAANARPTSAGASASRLR
jgi:hypothetical protein